MRARLGLSADEPVSLRPVGWPSRQPVIKKERNQNGKKIQVLNIQERIQMKHYRTKKKNKGRMLFYGKLQFP